MTAPRLHNLPAHRPALFGRADEVAAISERLLLAEGGLLTLTGAGGCGKTSLALSVARAVLETFSDGAWLVELAALSDPTLVPQAIASVFGVREGSGRPVFDALLGYLETRTLLLVLDNCEHLVEACAAQTAELLGECPSLRILATSREALRIPGEVLWRVPPLAVPDLERQAPPDQLLECAAVQLFVERARAVQPEFTLDERNAAAVSEVCARLEGMPLAIELAAARAAVLTPDQIVARLDDSFRLLRGGSRTAPSRQQTLKAALDWSFQLLSEEEQTLFRRLAVFAGGFDLGAAEAVCGGNGFNAADVLDVLTRLVQKSLVLPDQRADARRYRLLEPIRQYAQGCLDESGEGDAVRQRHFAHYLALAEAAQPQPGTGVPHRWRPRLELEHDNFRVALRWAAQLDDPAPAAQLVGALWWFWFISFHLSEGYRWHTQVLARDGVPPALRAQALYGASWLAWPRGDYDDAASLLAEGLAACRELGDVWGEAFSLMGQGMLADERGQPAASLPFHEQSLELFRTLGDEGFAGHALQHAGRALRRLGEHVEAGARLEASLEALRSTDDSWGAAMSLVELGMLARDRDDMASAASLTREGLKLFRETGARRYLAESLELAASVALGQNNPRTAARLFGAVASLRDATSTVHPPDYVARYERELAQTLALLGEAAFQAAWSAGRGLRPEQAIDEALATDEQHVNAAPALADGHATAPTSAAAAGGPLSERELEVAALIAQGLTNDQIATTLVISPRTAHAHVRNILSKLGFDSRVQVAAWAVARGL